MLAACLSAAYSRQILASRSGLTEWERIQLHPQIRVQRKIHTAQIPVRSQRQRLFGRRPRVGMRTGRARRAGVTTGVRLRRWRDDSPCFTLKFSQDDTVSEIGRIALCGCCEVRLNSFRNVEQFGFFVLRGDIGQTSDLTLDDPDIYYRESVEGNVLGILSARWHG